MGKIILRLDRMMADRKMSLNELAEKVGVSNVNLSKMKTGKISAIRFSTLVAICEALNCQPGDILEYDPDAVDEERRRFDSVSNITFAASSWISRSSLQLLLYINSFIKSGKREKILSASVIVLPCFICQYQRLLFFYL